ncbi:sulfate adenylyltransferase subunit 1 [Xanthovirga aplysinae]|uniref:sulfate adenylyltransferase subunit 1 n=1 Tax=Xanthovirga aplysinae TaxID=2529853 RepID=UPI0012BC2637|nr:GTP-binding protein [Xanthovirga aplysinae]MTI31290.1 sulfate adenylyltransferase [Xanthovirga aplysinae]
MDVLRISTAGSVDDGKSTLIGRLLYDTHSLTQDQLHALEVASERRGLDSMDLSLFTDGLTAEREQGITIDVAHIYFSTENRKFIIADTPGHVEYTRNMITGASNSQVAVILIDARHGVVEQSRRHYFITSLLRIEQVVVCVNKMDLVDYEEQRYYEIASEFQELRSAFGFEGQQVQFIPASALKGDNIVHKSDKMSWYEGPSLLSFLQQVQVKKDEEQLARFPVQWINRPKEGEFRDYRGYSGKVASGDFQPGDQIVVLNSGQRSTITSIDTMDGQLKVAKAGESVTLVLKDDIDISRGDLIVKENELPEGKRQFASTLCWLDKEPLNRAGKYILQHGHFRTLAKLENINYLTDPQTLKKRDDVDTLRLNDIAQVHFKTAGPVYTDSFEKNKANGSFILIDPQTNATVGVGFAS